MSKKYNKFCDKNDFYIGQQFHNLLVTSSIYIEKRNGNWQSLVKCTCKCGQTDIPCKISELVRGRIKSCGCLGLKRLTAFGETKSIAQWTRDSRCVVCYTTLLARLTVNKKEKQWTPEEAITILPDIKVKSGRGLEGKKFYRLSVLNKTINSKRGKNYWRCKCDCGKIIFTRGYRLITGAVKSCGCYVKELLENQTGERCRKAPGHSAKHNLISSYKYGAKNRDITWELSDKDFFELTQKNCFYCNTKPSQIAKPSTGNNGNYIYNGIDRIDNDIGYTILNSFPCCRDCNLMKTNLNYSDFISHVDKICKNNSRHKIDESKFKKVYNNNLIIKLSLVKAYQTGAKSRKLDWKVTDEYFYFLTSQLCYYCGCEPQQKTSSKILYNGVDRLNNNLGYLPNNCVSCCGKCNWMKLDKTEKDFLGHINNINKFRKTSERLLTSKII